MKLSDLFVGWYEYPEDEYKDILKNALISFDTNILLNMYRYSKKASSETFEALKTIKDRILISYYVAKEFTNNRKKVKTDNLHEYENLLKLIEDSFSRINAELDKSGEKKLAKISEIKKALEKGKESAIKYISDEKVTKSEFYKSHVIEKNISEIFLNKLTTEYTDEEFKTVKEEGLKRFVDKIPPGYKDEEKKENGDYYIFKSLIDYCKKNGKDLIFITNDKKEDWFRNIGGITEPREELLNEFYKETGKKLLILDFDNFIKNDVIFKKKISDEVVSEIYEINKLQNIAHNGRIKKIQKYLYLILYFNTIKDLQNNYEEILRYYKKILEIHDGVPNYSLIEKLYLLLCDGKYSDYLSNLNYLKSILNYKEKNVYQIRFLYTEFRNTLSVDIGLKFLSEIFIYIKKYLNFNDNSIILLEEISELISSKENDEIDDEDFKEKIISIYNCFNELINNVESEKFYE